MSSHAYFVLFLISFLLLGLLVTRFRNKVSPYYALLFGSVVVSLFGDMLLSTARITEASIMAVQINYLGSSFSIYLLFMCILDQCKSKIKRSTNAFLLIYSFVILMLTLTIGKNGLYYKSINLVKVGGTTILEKDYGPLHELYPLLMIIIVAMSFNVIIKAFRHKKDVSHITVSVLLIIMFTLVSMYVGERLLQLEVDVLQVAFVLAQVGILALLQRISMYDLNNTSVGSMISSKEYGFVVYDISGRFLGADDEAKIWFPELSEIQVDTRIKVGNSEFLKQVEKWINGEDSKKTVHLSVGDLIIEAVYEKIKVNGGRWIHSICLRDDTKQQKYLHLVEKYNVNLEKSVNEKTENLRNMQSDIIISMASIVENRDSNTGGHIARTSDIVKIFVNHLQEKPNYRMLTREVAGRIIKAAPLHDFGKIGIPDVVLNKPGKFTDEEYEIMKTHSAKGAVIVERILQNTTDTEFRKIAVNVAHFHHEKWDGRGYPTGIKGTEIPFEARVMALADVFDALVSKRVYKESFNYDKAFGIIEESSGSHFDPELCKEFLECRPLLEELYDSYDD